MERVQSENRLAGSPEQSKIIKHKGRSGGEEVCQHHNVNTAGRDEEEEEEEGGRKTKKKKEKEEEEKGNEKHKHLIKCRSGLDKAGLFFSSVQFTVNNFSVGYMQGQHLELHMEISYAYIGYLCKY